VEYRGLGAKFAKWRAVIDIGPGIPTATCIDTNAHALARYAALCQDEDIVPIVEPEVLMDGAHDIDRCREATEWTLQQVFAALYEQRIKLEGMVLKPNMVIAGKKCPQRASVAEVAEKTVRVLKACVPAAVPGIAFLSGGQSDEEATAHLDAMNKNGGDRSWSARPHEIINRAGPISNSHAPKSARLGEQADPLWRPETTPAIRGARIRASI